uniref:Peptidase M14 carboxypeptidase A domain-containing protein n=1 Tax=Panagrolaimus sp. JU765 TaxID=591449 RepID=A0AC34QNM8_9BILA
MLKPWIRALIFCSFAAGFQSYRGYKLFQIETGEEILPFLEELESKAFQVDEKTGQTRQLVDVWAEPHQRRRFAHVMVAPEFVKDFKTLLRQEGFNDFRIIKKDIQKDIDKTNWRQNALKSRRRKRRLASSSDLNIQDFNGYDQIVDYLDRLVTEFPEFTAKFDIGQTFEGRKMFGIKIGSKIRKFKPAIFIDAGVHAREWIAPAAAIYVIDKLVRGYGKVGSVTGLVDKFDWYIVPVANPDGYVYSFEKDRMWRKTRSRNMTVNKWCVGADANRNWGGRGWGEIGANRSPCSNIYAGAIPFSEPEVIAMKKFIENEVKDLKIYISLHSYGQLFLSPWGYTQDKPDNHDDQMRAAQLAVEAIKNETGRHYHHGTIAEIMYPASGTSIDYMQDLGVPYIYGIELRPEDIEDNFGFTVPTNQIEPTGRELFAALTKMSDYVVEHKMLRI